MRRDASGLNSTGLRGWELGTDPKDILPALSLTLGPLKAASLTSGPQTKKDNLSFRFTLSTRGSFE